MLCVALLACAVRTATAFSLLGPLKDAGFPGEAWQGAGFGGQPGGLGYDLTGDIGGPMFPFEAYRWSVPVITYAYDFTFLRYFGTNGVAAVDEAMAILNALPPASRMSEDLSEYPLDTRSENATASTVGLVDLRSVALALMLEQIGLANPERFVWGLRGRFTGQNFTNYSVIQLNYDPVTIQPSRFVNGLLYNYQIFDALGRQGNEFASAVEWFRLDPLHQEYSSVAGGLGSPDLQLGSSPGNPQGGLGGGFIGGSGGLGAGQFFAGLTRDDVGGIRYLLSTNNMVFETLPPTVLPRVGGTAGSPWAPIIGVGLTNAAALSNAVTTVGTNFTNFVRTALRPGLDKITFQRVGLLGTNFTPITLRYTDRFINPTNGRIVRQTVERLIAAPDIIFSVRDLGLAANSATPIRTARTTTAGWINNAAMNSFNGAAGLGGPGNITPGIEIIFTDLYAYWSETGDGSIEDQFSRAANWGHFDGTTRPPVVFPVFSDPLRPEFSLEFLQDVVLRRTGN